jgi:hypothetical protein
VNGFLGHWWGHGWIWIALGLFAAMAATLVGLTVPYCRRVRACLDTQDSADSEGDRLLRSRVPVVILLVAWRGTPHDPVADDAIAARMKRTIRWAWIRSGSNSGL